MVTNIVYQVVQVSLAAPPFLFREPPWSSLTLGSDVPNVGIFTYGMNPNPNHKIKPVRSTSFRAELQSYTNLTVCVRFARR